MVLDKVNSSSGWVTGKEVISGLRKRRTHRLLIVKLLLISLTVQVPSLPNLNSVKDMLDGC